MKNLMLALCILCFLPIQAQDIPGFKAADVIALNAPDSCQASVAALGRYFSKAFKDQTFRLRAIYTWTAMNINYDLANMGKANAATPFNVMVDQTMQTRTAICQGYASVFKAICDACGIKAWIVNGYTRQNGHINEMSHAWVVVPVDTSWYGFDPTWGGGYVTNGKYVRHFTEKFFMVKPHELIKDHMPFDPMWQCLSYPISNSEFSSGKTDSSNRISFFAYADSINAYQAKGPGEQCQDALRRLQTAGVINNMLMEWAKYLRDCIANGTLNEEVNEKNKYVRQFNDAVASYNNCIYAFNQYADYWNRQFTPSKPEPVIVSMLQTCYDYLDSCKQMLARVVAGDPGMKQSTDQLKLAVDEARDNLDKQKVFLKIYFNTDPTSRPQLFRNYNGAGFPTRNK
ncbi:MAG: hypothetical protein NTU51_00560 [Bacteroidetes bacterium]|nr:hypothetical protein [Bacteroidota bacterium]